MFEKICCSFFAVECSRVLCLCLEGVKFSECFICTFCRQCWIFNDGNLFRVGKAKIIAGLARARNNDQHVTLNQGTSFTPFELKTGKFFVQWLSCLSRPGLKILNTSLLWCGHSSELRMKVPSRDRGQADKIRDPGLCLQQSFTL